MTTHYADFGANAGLDFGTSVTLFAVTPADTTAAAVKTATGTVEHAPGTGVYRATFDTVAAGTYLLRAIAGGVLRASWFVEFAGTNGEIVLGRLDYERVTLTQMVNGIMAGGNIDSYSLEAALRLILAAAAGKLAVTNNGTTNTFRAANDSKARITATVDSSGNRSAIVLDATD